MKRFISIEILALLIFLFLVIPLVIANSNKDNDVFYSIVKINTYSRNLEEGLKNMNAYIELENQVFNLDMELLSMDTFLSEFATIDLEGNQIVPIGSGSGTIISRDGMILTNHHVVEGITSKDILEVCYYISEYDIPKCNEYARLVNSSELFDLALVYPEFRFDPISEKYKMISTNERDYHTISIHPFPENLEDLPKMRDEVSIIGYPGAVNTEQIAATKGIITGTDAYTEYNDIFKDYAIKGYLIDFYLTDAIVTPGNSGGAAVDDDNLFIGIPSYGSEWVEGGQYAYFIPFHVAATWIDKLVESNIVNFNPFKEMSGLRSSADEPTEIELLNEKQEGNKQLIENVERKQTVLEKHQDDLETYIIMLTTFIGGFFIVFIALIIGLNKARKKMNNSLLIQNTHDK